MAVHDLDHRDIILLEVACALIVHAIYRHYEPDTAYLSLHLFLLLALPSIPVVAFSHYVQGPHGLAILAAFTVFYLSLVLSVILYRLSPWHPLSKYPGPLIAKMSKFWVSYRAAKGRLHIDLKKLHDKYGPRVRIGPNELSVVDASWVPAIMTDGMPKGPMWKARVPHGATPALIAIQSTREHARRRKRWNRAFNTASVKNYEPIIQGRALQLVTELERRSVKAEMPSLNFAEWMTYFATDFMGDMAFGGGFELMRDGGDKDGVWTLLEGGLRTAAILQQLPWIMPILRRLPVVGKTLIRIREFGIERARARKINGSFTKDLFYHLIDEDKVEKDTPTEEEIVSDGTLAIIAGSDTTSTTLSGLFYYLMSNPFDYRRLQNEVDAVFPRGEGDPFDTLKLSEMPFLNAVINEALRLQPPVPTYLQRQPEAGTGGKWIGDSFIGEGTSVVVPPYVLFRNPDYFSPAPDSFWPDRWLERDAIKRPPYSADLKPGMLEYKYTGEVKTNTAAFTPFSYGPANCAGRALAQTEMRMVVALLMQRFDFQFGPGFNPKEWEERLEDFFVVSTGPLPVTLMPRV